MGLNDSMQTMCDGGQITGTLPAFLLPSPPLQVRVERSEVAGVLPVLWLLSLSPSTMSRCRDPITTHVRVDFSSLHKGTARVFREGGSGFANGVRLTSVSGEEEGGGPARVLHT